MNYRNAFRFTRPLVITGLSVALMGMTCSNPDAFNHTSDPAPVGSTEISASDFNRGLQDGSLLRFNLMSAINQDQAARDQEAADDARILQFTSDNPSARNLLPPLPDPQNPEPSAVPLRDGTFRHSIRLETGDSSNTITQGVRQIKRSAVHALDSYYGSPSLQQQEREAIFNANQRAIYENLYNNIPDRARIVLENLPDPSSSSTTPQMIAAANLRLSSASSLSIIGRYLTIDTTIPTGHPNACSEEAGSNLVREYDRNGSDDSNTACQHKPNGVFNRYNWGQKWWHTCVKDQANRGTCVAFANTAALEYWVAKNRLYNGIHSWVNLSEQAHYNRMKLTWADPRQDYGDGYGCDYAYTKMEQDHWSVPFENRWDYNPSTSRQECDSPITGGTLGYFNSCVGYSPSESCSDSAHQSGVSCMTDSAGNRSCAFSVPNLSSTTGFRVTTHAQLWDGANVDFSTFKVALAALLGTPVALELSVVPAWDGVDANGFVTYVANQKSRGGHAVTVTGYINNTDLANAFANAGFTPPQASGGGYFIIKNSWSSCWGDAGYVYVPWDYVRNYSYSAVAVHGAQSNGH